MINPKIYIVASFTNTWPGRLIIFRAALKFWNRYDGDTYSHISISLDDSLTKMFSFARKTINNPFNAGFIKENIHSGMFARNFNRNRITVFELDVLPDQYQFIENYVNNCWIDRDFLKFNYIGLIVQLICGRGISRQNHFFCSQWVATVLNLCGIDLFNKNPVHVRPFDFYVALKDCIIYEGLVQNYKPILSISERMG
jgi:hypothetical protein